VLERSTVLSRDALDAVAQLEAASLAHDGGRLKLEWGALEHRTGDVVNDVLWWQDGRLVGFAGLYAFGSPTVEVTGMVDPGHRRRGIGAMLLDETIACCRERGLARFLLVTPRGSDAAQRLASSRGGVLEHSEHALALTGAVAEGPSDDSLTLRPATRADTDDVVRILTAAFDHPHGPIDLEAHGEQTLVAERGGAVVATLRVHKSPEAWGVYGFAVEPQLQGHGIGRDVLRRVCRQANEAGIVRVHLEVSVDNDRALTLYTSLGFAHETTEDYYELPL
jgi:ribosomal protein S18 acetylase RimI-like enzyme